MGALTCRLPSSVSRLPSYGPKTEDRRPKTYIFVSFVVWVVVVFAVTSIPAHAEGASVAPSPGPRLQFAVASAAQPQRAQPGQEEFVPIDELPAEDRLPAAPLLVAAYAFAWVAILGYLWSIWRRLARVERELADATRTAGERRT